MASGAPTSLCSVGAMLGEGPCWSAAEQKLWFVDIKRQILHRFAPATGMLESWLAPAQPGWVLPATGDRLVAGLQTGLHLFSPEDGRFTPLEPAAADLPGNRLNDATVDPLGRLWFGTMDDAEERPTGRVYRYAGGHLSAAEIAPTIITNGPAFSPDGRTLYHVDTLAGTIYALDVASDGTVSRPRLFAQIAPADGYPDGPTVDSEGCLWIGLFGGWGVRRYAPDGRLLDFVRFPVANVTKIAFGGEDFRTVYATTARKGLSDADLRDQPLAGNLFTFRAATPGLAMPPIKLEN